MKHIEPRLLWYIPSLLLFIAIFKLPSTYYEILRLIVFGSSLVIAYKNSTLDNTKTVLLFIIIALLFNPIIPIYLDRQKWVLIDIVVSIIFFINANQYYKNTVIMFRGLIVIASLPIMLGLLIIFTDFTRMVNDFAGTIFGITIFSLPLIIVVISQKFVYGTFNPLYFFKHTNQNNDEIRQSHYDKQNKEDYVDDDKIPYDKLNIENEINNTIEKTKDNKYIQESVSSNKESTIDMIMIFKQILGTFLLVITAIDMQKGRFGNEISFLWSLLIVTIPVYFYFYYFYKRQR